MRQDVPLSRDLVLIGGGHTHALVLKRWGMNPLPGARLTVINPGPTAPYTGMLPGYVAGHYSRRELDIDLVRLARFAGARLILGAATHVDRSAKTISVTGRPDISYDIASIDVGITSNMPEIPGFASYGIGAKPLDAFARKWQSYLDRPEPGDIVLIGGGVAGVELALAMAHALHKASHSASITIVDSGRVLAAVGAHARRALLAELDAAGVKLIEGDTVAELGPDVVHLNSGGALPCGLCVGAAGARAYPWLSQLGLETIEGAIVTDDWLRSSDPSIYAVGDCAVMRHHPRPRAGVFAVRAAPTLFHNLRADLAGFARKAHRPQRNYLKLVSLGRKAAFGEKFGAAVAGDWVWRWKDRIDRKFMDRLSRLEPMSPPAPPRLVAQGAMDALQGGQPLCGGCGAKVGADVLTPAIVRTARNHRSDITALPGDDAALLSIGDTQQVLTTDHLRSFMLDTYVMAKITANHALSDVLAMGAAPQAVLSSIVLPRMSEEMQARWLREIMAGAEECIGQVGADIVGGHTTLGDELTIGFTVTGLVPDAPITLSGAQPGDALILTRPIGSGVLLAAEMALAARGAWIADLWADLAKPHYQIAACLRQARAMTDVTGFGLAGHLMNMLEASGVAAEISLDDVPIFPGAAELAERGIRSSLFAANHRIRARMTLPEGPRADLLFDPQTAGGFLAAIAAGQSDTVISGIADAGGHAVKIGEITEGAAHITVT